MDSQRKLPPGIRLTRAGRYQIRYTGPDGIRRSGGTFRTVTDAKRTLAAIQTSISNRTWRERKARIEDGELSGKSLLSEWSEEWIVTRSSATGEPLSSSTKKYYRSLIAAGLSSFDRPIETITSAQVRRWWAGYRADRPRAANSCYKYLKSLMSLAETRGAIYENPCDIPGAASYAPRQKGKLPQKEAIDQLIEKTLNPWRTFFALVVFGGFRRGEIAELRVGDILWPDNAVSSVAITVERSVKWITNSTVEVGRPKSRAGTRTIWLGPTPAGILAEYLTERPIEPDALLFSRDPSGEFHLLESTIRNQVRKTREQFGIKEPLHRLRDYSLTLYAQQGATLQELMRRGGHSNVSAAMAYQRDAGRDAELAAGMG